MRKKDETCNDATMHDKLDELEQTLGLLDAAFSYLSILHPIDEQKREAREAVEAISMNWRMNGLSISLRHMYGKNIPVIFMMSGVQAIKRNLLSNKVIK